jgi:hypothetical protein
VGVRVAQHRNPLLLGAVSLGVAARYLGTTTQKLRDGLAHGWTLAAITSATPGRSTTGLVDALLAPRRVLLARAVKRGTITPAQAQHALTRLRPRVETVVQQTHG